MSENRPSETSIDESLDLDLQRLLEITHELSGATDLADRERLTAERRTIRARWAVTSVEQASTARLARLESALLTRLDDLHKRRLEWGSIGANGGVGSGLDPLATILHNRTVDADFGRDELVSQLHEVRREIQRRSAG